MGEKALRLDFVSIGEVLIQLNPLSPGPLRYVKYFELHVAGSEANILVGLSKVGFKTGLITRVGDDEFGKAVINFLRSEGVDVSQVKVDKTSPTGVYFIQRHFPVPGKSTVFYYRHGSAASNLDVNDIDEGYVKSAHTIILTGITPALSRTCREAVFRMYEIAIRDDLKIIIDTNVRLKLWKGLEEARNVIKELIKNSYIVLTNVEDLEILYPDHTPLEASKKVIDSGANFVVVKMGDRGAFALSNKGEMSKAEAFKMPIIEDVIGAGDAFDAIFIASVYRGLSLDEALKYANIAGALATTVRGDVEAQPTWKDLETFLESLKKEVFLR